MPSIPKGKAGTPDDLARMLRAFVQILPILLGMLPMTSLILAWLPRAF